MTGTFAGDYAGLVFNRQVQVPAPVRSTTLQQLLEQLEGEFQLPGPFSAPVLAAAEHAVAELAPAPEDHTDLPFFTLDPATSTDLDQAMHLSETATGYRIHYAIADVPALVELGGVLDAATRQRGQTIYLPHRRIPLHPEVIGEDHGSLLPGRPRRAFIWVLDLDAEGQLRHTALHRSMIRSRAKRDYLTAQQQLDSGAPDAQLVLLQRIGRLRISQEARRRGASLNLPEQDVQVDAHGNYTLVSRTPLPVEDYNAQISLLTGMAAAELMLQHKVGILRTMPPPRPEDLAEFRMQSRVLGHRWEEHLDYGQFLRTLDVCDPAQLVLMHRAAALFRGADYQVINGQPDTELVQAALAAPYAHATAPLRRLVDRFVLLTCHLLCRQRPIPQPLLEALEELPGLMRTSSAEAAAAGRASIALIEAWVLQHRVGEHFDAVVLTAATANGQGKLRPGQVQLLGEAITGSFTGSAPAASLVSVRLEEADPLTRRCRFSQVAGKVTP